MASTHFTYALNGLSGTPTAKLEIVYREGVISENSVSGQHADGSGQAHAEVIVHLSPSVPLGQREESLTEYHKLSEVLGLPTRLNEQKTSLAIELGEKSPEALMMFITGDLEKRSLIGKTESKNFIAAILARDETTPPASRISDPMHAAIRSAHSQGAGVALHETGVEYMAQNTGGQAERISFLPPKAPAKNPFQIG